MKKMLRSFLLFSCAILLLSSCDGKETRPAATGRAYEVMVISTHPVWASKAADTLRAILTDPVPMLNQHEPSFDPKQLVPQGFVNVMQRHRNVIFLNIGPEFTTPSIGVQYDVMAAPQLFVQISGPNENTLADYIGEHAGEVRQVLEMAERDRYVSYALNQTEKPVKDKIFEKFGFELSVPKGYKIRTEADDFLWVSFELPTVSQGLIIYSYPYTGRTDFEADSLVAKRNKFVSLVPGPSPGSYMTTAPTIDPIVSYRRILGRAWSEMRGLWDVEGDFMGGPFVSYSTLDAPNNRVICIDEYVFSPKYGKRNYIRELEHVIFTVKFPSDTTQEAEE